MRSRRDRFFAWTWGFQSRHDNPALARWRSEVAAGATGRVLEVGVGLGNNWRYLPPGIEYTGVEPNEYLLPTVRARGAAASPRREIEPGDVQQLPFDDGSFDTVLCTLVLCSVDDPGAGLREIRRVLKPDGQLRFLEHVRAHGRFRARLQGIIRPLTRTLGGGCEWDRDTLALIEEAGFVTDAVSRGRLGPLPIIVGQATPTCE